MPKVKVPKDFAGELLIAGMSTTLLADQEITLSDEYYKSADVQLAITKGFLVPLNKPKPKESPKKIVAKVKSMKQKMGKTKKQPTKKEESPEQIQEPETDMRAWDGRSQELLDKDNSAKKTMGDLNATAQPPVQTGDIDFSDKPAKKSTAKKSTAKKKTAREKTSTRKKSAKSKAKSTLKKAAKAAADIAKDQRKSLKPVGNRRQEPTADDNITDPFVPSHNEPEGISFVDQEQKEERLAEFDRIRQAKMNEEVE